ncbi:MAG: hypothetical protein HOV96_08265 [Nonomuraea sp.]|nr:hypothetical protein [Nonomuraea sp.]NUP77528.1 hypothetical protein [Nonomuraea sp.]NUS01861.1 hypothetical protein [Nonomuraea sp.]NUT41430.1 hypothetical protein [Thermoactinospora sp.]
MNHLLTRVLVAAGAAGVVLATQAGPAAADPTSWKWGAIHSTDGMATARGKVVVGQSGLVVTGHLDDSYGKGCSWVLVKYQSGSTGRWRTHGIYNCVTGTGSFRKSVGGALQIRAQVCRGTSQRPVDKCSRWRTIYTQGG